MTGIVAFQTEVHLQSGALVDNLQIDRLLDSGLTGFAQKLQAPTLCVFCQVDVIDVVASVNAVEVKARVGRELIVSAGGDVAHLGLERGLDAT